MGVKELGIVQVIVLQFRHLRQRKSLDEIDYTIFIDVELLEERSKYNHRLKNLCQKQY